MTDNAFHRLAPFIRQYVYRQGWTELHPLQVQAISFILDSDDHLLLASGTATGKTEAAFLPILTALEQDPAHSLGVLYIGPTKALINDQFERLQGLLAEAAMPVWSWHGDVGQTQKRQMLRQPRGILQITPESLESLLINHGAALPALVADLRFVIIDEVHVFMGSERGQQILCQLARLQAHMQAEPRRVGLSATLGDYAQAAQWLRGGSQRSVLVPQVEKRRQRLRLAVEHFQREAVADPVHEPYYRYLFQHTLGRKSLIFANSREQAETITAALRRLAKVYAMPDIYHVHHGSIATAGREATEIAMRDPYRPAVTAATVTLELGIDLGQLENVVQLEAPLSVKSWLQRLGRSGRRGQPQEMRMVSSETDVAEQLVPLPWQLLQNIAICELYLKERWIEPIAPPRYPFSLLYQQTMSILLAAGEMSPATLAQRVLALPPFAMVTPDHYRQLLRHLLQIDHLQRLENGNLIIGFAAETVVHDWRFFAVFTGSEEYIVREAQREIGRVSSRPSPGDRIVLAGATWEVLAVEQRQVLVRAAAGPASGLWQGTVGNIHPRVIQRLQQVLLQEEDYRYLQTGAQQRLQSARRWVRSAG